MRPWGATIVLTWYEKPRTCEKECNLYNNPPLNLGFVEVIVASICWENCWFNCVFMLNAVVYCVVLTRFYYFNYPILVWGLGLIIEAIFNSIQCNSTTAAVLASQNLEKLIRVMEFSGPGMLEHRQRMRAAVSCGGNDRAPKFGSVCLWCCCRAGWLIFLILV